MTPEDLAQIQAIVRAEVTASEERVLTRAAGTARDMQTEILRGLEGFARGTSLA